MEDADRRQSWKAFWKGDISFSERKFAESQGGFFSTVKLRLAAHKQGSAREREDCGLAL